MATHSSALAWKIPWMEEPGRLQSMGPQRVGHDWVTSLSGKNTGVGYHFLLQGIFPTQGSNPRLLHWQTILFTTEPPEKIWKPDCNFKFSKTPWRARVWQTRHIWIFTRRVVRESLLLRKGQNQAEILEHTRQQRCCIHRQEFGLSKKSRLAGAEWVASEGSRLRSGRESWVPSRRST